jgi:hypothetical protein
MKHKLQNKLLLIQLYLILFIYSPLIALADNSGVGLSPGGFSAVGQTPDSTNGAVNTPTQFSRLQNPIEANSFQELINDIVFIAMLIGGPLVVLAFVYTGFLFVKAQGNSTKLSEAKDALLYTVIGAFILLGAQVIASLVGGTVDQFRSTP